MEKLVLIAAGFLAINTSGRLIAQLPNEGLANEIIAAR